ncbi:MAG: translation initiation factor IF-2 subunit gamma [Candidatus Altiarchaeota archaeon]
MKSQPIQSELNIGLVGHVDHGKTTLTKALSGVWTDRHSEEIKRGISIRLGYADCTFYKCPKCNEPECYCTSERCPNCNEKTEFLRRVSFVDSPGHESLMAVMLSGAAIMDGALLVIAANEQCPQPQTEEHLLALTILNVKNIVVVQNKIDLVSKEKAIENYEQIKNFLKGTIAEDAPIIPIAANCNANIDLLIKTIQDRIPTPKRDPNSRPLMYIARSFDINKPGVKIDELKGGVVGGSLLRGKLKVGDEIELRPGVKKTNNYRPITTKIVSLNACNQNVKEVYPGGLIGIGTNLDPALTKSDGMCGNVLGLKGQLPEVYEKIKIDFHLFEKTVGDRNKEQIKSLERNEALMLSVGSAVTIGILTDPKSKEFTLKIPVCAEIGQRVAISRRFGARWRLIGYGAVVE